MQTLQVGHGFVRSISYTVAGDGLIVGWGTPLHTHWLYSTRFDDPGKVDGTLIPYGEMALAPGRLGLVRMNMTLSEMPPSVFLEFINLSNRKFTHSIPLACNLTSLGFSADERDLLVAGYQLENRVPMGEVTRWRGKTAVGTTQVPAIVVSMATTRDNRWLVTGCADNTARFWLDHEPLPAAEWRFKSSVRKLVFAPDEKTLAAAAGCSVAVWSIAAGRQQVRLRPHARQVNDIAFSPSGKLLATAGHDGVVRFWDTDQWTLRQSFDWGIGKIGAVAFAPDGMTAVAGAGDGRLVIWDVDGD
jgi:WD40 repeat protein